MSDKKPRRVYKPGEKRAVVGRPSSASKWITADSPLGDRASMVDFMRKSCEQYIADYQEQRKELKATIKTATSQELKSAGVAAMKSLQGNYTRFLSDLDKRYGALADLMRPSDVEGTVINIVLPDYGAVPVAEISIAVPEDVGEKPPVDEENKMEE